MKLIFITGDPARASIADAVGVDRIMVDLEIEGKLERQGHLDTLISQHSYSDITRVRGAVHRGELMVRVNPYSVRSSVEVDECVNRGADRFMLPMFKKVDEVSRFLDLVAERRPVTLLVETPEALGSLDKFLRIDGIDDIHFGLNDLHLGLRLDFMFELLSEGIIEAALPGVKKANCPFGIGGVARIGSGYIPAELVIAEYLRLGASAVILSRDFNRIFESGDASAEIHRRFADAIRGIREQASAASENASSEEAHRVFVSRVREVAERIRAQKSL